MKYTKNHPSFNFVQALHLDMETAAKIGAAISSAWRDDDTTPDMVIAEIAPLLNTPEVAFYAGFTLLREIEAAKSSAIPYKRKSILNIFR